MQEHNTSRIERTKREPAAPEFAPSEPREGKSGLLLGVVLVFVLALVGALYVYGGKLSKERSRNLAEEAQSLEAEDPELDLIESEIESLENFDEFGSDLEAELDAAFGE